MNSLPVKVHSREYQLDKRFSALDNSGNKALHTFFVFFGKTYITYILYLYIQFKCIRDDLRWLCLRHQRAGLRGRKDLSKMAISAVMRLPTTIDTLLWIFPLTQNQTTFGTDFIINWLLVHFTEPFQWQAFVSGNR